MVKSVSNVGYNEGEIVVVRYQENPNLPLIEYVSYVREHTNPNSSITFPLTNIQREIKDFNSRRGSRTLDLIFGRIHDVTRLKRERNISTPVIGELYEVECNDPDVSSIIPGDNEGLSFKVVGCYAGIRPVGGHKYYLFSNVCETDPEKIKPQSRDMTYGRRVFTRVRHNEHLKIKRLSKK